MRVQVEDVLRVGGVAGQGASVGEVPEVPGVPAGPQGHPEVVRGVPPDHWLEESIINAGNSDSITPGVVSVSATEMPGAVHAKD
jgi:hypothetical protein